MNYQVYTPAPELQPFIKCYWTLEAEAMQEAAIQRVVPDGCMELIVHYGDLYRQYFRDGSSIVQPRSFIFGQITKYIEIAPTGVSGIIAARFLPNGATPFLDMPVTELEDRAVSTEEIFGEKGKALEDQVLLANTVEERIQLIEHFLLSQLTRPEAVDAITSACIEAILQSQGQLDVIDLADKINVHRRNIERRFSSAVGMSPKQLAKVTRLQATLKMLEQKKFTSLTALAYENGYYDQAHFIRDFKEFTGLSPKSFYADSLRFAAFFASAE